MAQTILIKRSSIPGKIPLITDLQLSELGVNTADGKLYIKKNNGTESIVDVGDTANALNTNNAYTAVSFNSITALSSSTPNMDSIASIGASTTVARSDHTHASDTSKANTNQTMYIGTTALTINRTSGSQNLTGINIDGNSATVTTNANLTGDIISVGNTTSLVSTAVTGKLITNFTSASGSIVATDTILQAINKLDGNIGLKSNTASPTFTGTLTAPILSSTIATGTAPLLITSTTLVPNLNTDLLDGQHGSYYAPIASPTFTGTVTSTNDVVINGNLTVNGTTSTINSTTISVDDINIELGSVVTPTDITAVGGGITLKGATDKTITWSSANGWSSSESINIVTGKTYKINGTDVLSSSVLGSGITTSSLTSVGTITTGVWNGTVLSPTYGGTGINNGTKTITLGGNLVTSGAYTTTLTTSNNTNITLPTTGTLSTLSGSETLTNKTYNGLSVTSNAIGFTLSGGTTAVAPTFIGGSAYTISGTNGTTITLPTNTGTLIGSGDTGTVTNTMLAGSITNAKLSNSTISGVSLGSNLNTLTISTGLSGASYNGSGAVTIGIDSTVTTLSGTQTLTNKTLTTPIISSISNTGTLTLPTSTDTLVGKATTDILTNKSISGNTNTLSNIPNSALTNNTVTIGTTGVSLGSSSTILTGLTSVSSTTFSGNLTGYKNADNNNEMTLMNGYSGGVSYLNYRGASGAITQVSACNGLGTGTLIPIVGSNITATGDIIGNANTVTTNANLTGEVTSVGNTTIVTNNAVINKLITGFSSTSGNLATTDTILQAINKIDGNVNLKANIESPAFTGVVTSPVYALTNSRITDSILTLATVTQTALILGSSTAYRSVEILMQITEGTKYHSTKLNIIHDGSTAYITEYGTIYTSTSLTSLNADISGGNIRLLVISASANSTIYKFTITLINI